MDEYYKVFIYDSKHRLIGEEPIMCINGASRKMAERMADMLVRTHYPKAVLYEVCRMADKKTPVLAH